jgi:hypothetical protein
MQKALFCREKNAEFAPFLRFYGSKFILTAGVQGPEHG